MQPARQHELREEKRRRRRCQKPQRLLAGLHDRRSIAQVLEQNAEIASVALAAVDDKDEASLSNGPFGAPCMAVHGVVPPFPSEEFP